MPLVPRPLPTAAIARVTAHCRPLLAGAPSALGEEYQYAHLPLAVVDAIFSIGVTYTSTRNTVRRAAAALQLPVTAPSWPPNLATQCTVAEWLTRTARYRGEALARDLYGNRQRTSSTGGIRKADAVRQACEMLQTHGIETFQDWQAARADPARHEALERDWRAIPGQRSGISWAYVTMLAGDDTAVKPDRMVVRFVEAALGRSLGTGPSVPREAAAYVQAATAALQGDHPHLSARLLDHLIWQAQRVQPTPRAAPRTART